MKQRTELIQEANPPAYKASHEEEGKWEEGREGRAGKKRRFLLADEILKTTLLILHITLA